MRSVFQNFSVYISHAKEEKRKTSENKLISIRVAKWLLYLCISKLCCAKFQLGNKKRALLNRILTLLCLGGMFEPESRSYRVYTRKAHRPLLPFLLNYPPSEYDFSPFILLFDVPHTHAYAYITKKMERKNIFSTHLVFIKKEKGHSFPHFSPVLNWYVVSSSKSLSCMQHNTCATYVDVASLSQIVTLLIGQSISLRPAFRSMHGFIERFRDKNLARRAKSFLPLRSSGRHSKRLFVKIPRARIRVNSRTRATAAAMTHSFLASITIVLTFPFACLWYRAT